MLLIATVRTDKRGQIVVFPEGMEFFDGVTKVKIQKSGAPLIISPAKASKAKRTSASRKHTKKSSSDA